MTPKATCNLPNWPAPGFCDKPAKWRATITPRDAETLDVLLSAGDMILMACDEHKNPLVKWGPLQ